MRRQPVKGPDSYSPEWFAIRKLRRDSDRPVVFGASEAATALNQDPYTSPLELCLRKQGLAEEQEENISMKVGKALEPVVLDLYKSEANVDMIATPPMYLHPKYKFMAATPDAIVINSLGEWQRAVDAKVTSAFRYDSRGESYNKYGKHGTDELPLNVLCQVQQQMEVLDVKEADVPVLFDIHTLRIYHVVYVEELVVAIAKAEDELAQRIINNDLPEPNWQAEGTAKLLQSLYGITVGKSVDLSLGAVAHWEEYQSLGEQIKTLELQRTEAKNRLIYAMGDAELGRLGNGREVRRCQVRESIWTEADLAEIASSIGKVKREGHVRLIERKVK